MNKLKIKMTLFWVCSDADVGHIAVISHQNCEISVSASWYFDLI